MHTKVLIPLDGSESAEAAVDEAVAFASSVKSVHLISVEASSVRMRQLEGFAFYAERYTAVRRQAGLDYLLPFKEKLEAAGLEVSVSVEFGDSLPVIAESVQRDRIGLVILGGSGSGWLERHTGMARYARRLARKVGATILTVQPKDKLAPAA